MGKRGKPSKTIFVFFMFFLIWVLLQFISPLILPSNSITDLSGVTIVSDNESVIEKMPQPIGFVYTAGDVLCHQKAERSFFVNNNQMPFCSRCTGIWLGIVIGIGMMVFYRFELDEKIFFLIVLGILPLGVDGVGQLVGLWESINSARLVTGVLTGFVCGIAIGIIIDEFRDIFAKNYLSE